MQTKLLIDGALVAGEGTVEQDMDSHKKYLVETLKVTLKS